MVTTRFDARVLLALLPALSACSGAAASSEATKPLAIASPRVCYTVRWKPPAQTAYDPVAMLIVDTAQRFTTLGVSEVDSLTSYPVEIRSSSGDRSGAGVWHVFAPDGFSVHVEPDSLGLVGLAGTVTGDSIGGSMAGRRWTADGGDGTGRFHGQRVSCP